MRFILVNAVLFQEDQDIAVSVPVMLKLIFQSEKRNGFNNLLVAV